MVESTRAAVRRRRAPRPRARRRPSAHDRRRRAGAGSLERASSAAEQRDGRDAPGGRALRGGRSPRSARLSAKSEQIGGIVEHHHRHRRADQPAGAQRGHRGRPGRRAGPRLRRSSPRRSASWPRSPRAPPRQISSLIGQIQTETRARRRTSSPTAPAAREDGAADRRCRPAGAFEEIGGAVDNMTGRVASRSPPRSSRSTPGAGGPSQDIAEVAARRRAVLSLEPSRSPRRPSRPALRRRRSPRPRSPWPGTAEQLNHLVSSFTLV